jgi:2-C-methyl-D-erythritol 4-phosphate cytidylyltransferase
MTVAAVVPAAGAGRRFGGKTTKLFTSAAGRPLMAHTLSALQRSPWVRWIVVVARPEDHARMRALLARYCITKALPLCHGGSSRTESVAHGVAALPREARWVLVHDAARPCVSLRLIASSVKAAKRYGAVACGLPAAVTVKSVDAARRVRATLDRERLWFVQTPQVFRRDWFTKALSSMNGHFARCPDDAAVLEGAAFPVRMVAGEALNLKVTTREDLLLAQAILRRRQAVR